MRRIQRRPAVALEFGASLPLHPAARANGLRFLADVERGPAVPSLSCKHDAARIPPAVGEQAHLEFVVANCARARSKVSRLSSARAASASWPSAPGSWRCRPALRAVGNLVAISERIGQCLVKRQRLGNFPSASNGSGPSRCGYAAGGRRQAAQAVEGGARARRSPDRDQPHSPAMHRSGRRNAELSVGGLLSQLAIASDRRRRWTRHARRDRTVPVR